MTRSRFQRTFGKAFNYAHNPTSILGIVLITVSALSILGFIGVEMGGGLRNPYIGIFAYLILPAVFVLGLVLLPFGMWRRRRRLLKEGTPEEELRRYPRLDFNDPKLRRLATVVLLLTAVNAVIFGISSIFAVEYMESVEFCGEACHTVMQPEFVAYQGSPHSRVACVECHIGPGASWFVRSKLDGLRQVWHTALDTYHRPIQTPLETLRPARETCEQCHWPEKHYGDKVRVFARFDEDEENTPSYTAMLLKTGGGRLDLGTHGGIHWWHIYSDNRIRFVTAEEGERDEIVWVELVTPDGETRVYTRDGDELPAPAELEQRARIMDCIDCHNRPTHLFEPPSKALDHVLENRADIATLPFYKRQAMELVTAGYDDRDLGIERVREGLLAYYRQNHPEVWNERRAIVELGAESASRVYGRSYFPAMKTSWETHQNHIGHEDAPGCFRCHDEEMATADGEHVISLDCETCHAFLVDGASEPPDLASLVSG